MTKWESIDTAPKDGTYVLVCQARGPGNRPITGSTFGLFVQVASWWADDDGANGDWTVFGALPKELVTHFIPTHWMPLPEPPVSED